MKVAIVHDWLTNLGGGERVVEAFSRAFPDAPIYTSVYNPDNITLFNDKTVVTSFLQHWPLAKRKHQLFSLPRTWAFESFDLSGYDVVLSSASAEAKGVITSTDALHISYIHTPTRYYWSNYEQYLADPGLGIWNTPAKVFLPKAVGYMRRWDYAAAQRPDIMIANSTTVQKRIKKYYHRSSQVISPPVNMTRFRDQVSQEGDYYLVVSRLIPYKRVGLAVKACTELGKKLVVVGNGSELSHLKKIAGKSVSFVEQATDDQVTSYYVKCKAFIMTAYEDFGITPVEAMAAGKPVVAYGHGGVTDSVIDGKTGIYYDKQEVSALKQAILKLEKSHFNTEDIYHHATTFSEDTFIDTIQQLVHQQYEQKQTT